MKKDYLIFIALILAGFLLGMGVYRRECVVDAFEESGAADPASTEDAVARLLKEEEAQVVDARRCAVYYTNNAEECNNATDRFYQMPLEMLEGMQAGGGLDVATRARIQRVVDDRKSGRLPNGLCKFEFSGWVEPIRDNMNANPYKFMGPPNNSRGDPKDWAFCYSSTQSPSAFADGSTVTVSDTAKGITPFTDGKVYGRVAFNTFPTDPSFLCARRPVSVPNVPIAWLAFRKISNSIVGGMKIKMYDEGSMEMREHPYSQQIFAGLLAMQPEANGIAMVPRTIRTRLHFLQYDMCGRVVSSYASPETTTFSLAQLGISSTFFVTSSSPLTSGSIAQLEDKLQMKQQELGAKQADVAQPPSSAPVMVNGISAYHYEMDQKFGTPPNMSSTEALDILFGGAPEQAMKPRDDLARVQTKIRYERSPSSLPPMLQARFGSVFDGYLYLDPQAYPAGDYRFQISSDDGGDLFIDGKLVSSHYGYHGMNRTGTWGTVRLVPETDKYVPIRARYAQWYGGYGIRIYCIVPGMREQELPESVLFYDKTEADKKMGAFGAERETKTLEQEVVTLRTKIEHVHTDASSVVKSLMEQLPTRTMAISSTMTSSDNMLMMEILDTPSLGVTDPSSTVLGATNPSAAIHMLETPKNLCEAFSMAGIAPGVQDFSKVEYTLMLSLKIDQYVRGQRKVFQYGSNDEGTPTVMLQQSPTGENTISVVHGATTLDMTRPLPRNVWVPIVVRLNNDGASKNGVPSRSMEVSAFINGEWVAKISRPPQFSWNTLTGKSVRLGYNGTGCTFVHLNRVVWFNSVVPEEEKELYKNNVGS